MRVGQDTANWTTERLAGYLAQQTGIQVSEETVRVYLHAHDYDCKRSTWTRSAQSRIEWLWRVWRRLVTHNHHRGTFDLLLADLQTHFQILTRTPAEVRASYRQPVCA